MPRRAPAPDLDAALAAALSAPSRTTGSDPALDATTVLLGQYGLRNWTVDDVAQRSGIARATLYRHYGSRDVLVQLAVTREARRFIDAIAAEVTRTPSSLGDMVVDGMLAGLRLARRSPLGDMISRDPATAMSIIGSPTFLEAASTALADLYPTITTPGPTPPDGAPAVPPAPADRGQVRARAEALVRLALSFLLVPGAIDRDGDERARQTLRDMVAPLVGPGRFQPAERLLQDCYVQVKL